MSALTVAREEINSLWSEILKLFDEPHSTAPTLSRLAVFWHYPPYRDWRVESSWRGPVSYFCLLFCPQRSWRSTSIQVNSATDPRAFYTTLAFSSAAVVCIALNPAENAFRTTLKWGPLRYIGKISYGLYMLHPFIFGVISQLKFNSVVEMVLAVLLSVGAAALSWHFVESRILKLKEKLTDSKRSRQNLPAIDTN